MAWMLKKYWFFIVWLMLAVFCIVGIVSYDATNKPHSGNSNNVFSSSSYVEKPAPLVAASPATTLQDTPAGAGDSSEMEIINAAALRNHCYGDNFWLLMAVGNAENGATGRQFGIEHARCDKLMRDRPDDTLDIQAGWAAATIVKSRARWQRSDSSWREKTDADFIDYLANRYCPPIGDGSNHVNWKRNVKFWYVKYKKQSNLTADYTDYTDFKNQKQEPIMEKPNQRKHDGESIRRISKSLSGEMSITPNDVGMHVRLLARMDDDMDQQKRDELRLRFILTFG